MATRAGRPELYLGNEYRAIFRQEEAVVATFRQRAYPVAINCIHRRPDMYCPMGVPIDQAHGSMAALHF